MTSDIRPGLLVLHGNRLERLAETVFAWIARHPPGPLETEALLAPSNGVAEWLKIEAARALGVFAAARVELPSRFLWRAYRAVLGADAVPGVSPLDEAPLAWRLMRLLPTLAGEPGFEPVAGFLAAGRDAEPMARRLQLARRLADLFDGYQVHRPDWLADWAEGRDRLGDQPLPRGQGWQPALWRALLAELTDAGREQSRAALHRRFVDALRGGAGGGERPAARGARGAAPGLPRRVVLFGSSQLAPAALEALVALSARSQVLLAVPNPCRFHWADVIEGREAFAIARRRFALRGTVDPATLAPEALHAHGHPLLVAWGRQSRDFVRQLDAFDDAEAARQRFGLPRLDLFDEDAPATTLLEQVQAAIRDLKPLAEHPAPCGLPPPDAADRSIVFHVAHSAQREVEVLHDQLLQLFAAPPGGRPLAPREVVVMVPEIETFEPAIRAVFGAHAPGDARHVPWGIADLAERGRRPLLRALETLLHAGTLRLSAGDWLGLLDVPAYAARLALRPGDAARLAAWVEGAGIRWGLDAAHREALGLGAAGEVASWAFGLRRMLLGWAVGGPATEPGAATPPPLAVGPAACGEAAGPYAAIEPYPEVAGLDAALAGTLAEALDVLGGWLRDAGRPRPPAAWAVRFRALLAELFAPAGDDDRALLAALDEALARWLADCEAGGFDAPVPLAVAREGWLAALDEPAAARRFRAGGVTFCTLLPLRAIPFEVVCLLGMNDGDYPRRSPRNDFDLLALPGRARPGDRSRRDDDRQLMLDALLAARRVLHVSWAGRSVRDNAEQPPSVLVAQLRDHLDAAYGRGTVAARTTEHPLQPFGRRYFEQPPPVGATGPGLYTWATEWRVAHEPTPAPPAPHADAAARSTPTPVAAPTAVAVEATPTSGAGMAAPTSGARLAATSGAGAAPAASPAAAPGASPATVKALADFVRRPVRSFFRQRLRVAFDEATPPPPDDECFEAGSGLERWSLLDELLALLPLPRTAACRVAGGPRALEAEVEHALARLARAGRLPLGAPGRAAGAALRAAAVPLVDRAAAAWAARPHALAPLALRHAHPEDASLVLADVLDGLRAETPGGAPWRVERVVSKVARKTRDGCEPVAKHLVAPWLRSLAAAACGAPVTLEVHGEGSLVTLHPPPRDEAAARLSELLQAWRDGVQGRAPWPVAFETGLAALHDARQAAARYEGDAFADAAAPRGERDREAELGRLWPDYAALEADPGFAPATLRLLGGLQAGLATGAVAQSFEAAASDAGGDAGSDGG